MKIFLVLWLVLCAALPSAFAYSDELQEYADEQREKAAIQAYMDYSREGKKYY